MIQPSEVYYGELIFGTSNLNKILIVTPNKQFMDENNMFREIVKRWSDTGLSKDTEFYPKRGVDKEKAIRHVECLLNSRYTVEDKNLRHATAAHLLSIWFDAIKYVEPFFMV